MTYGHITDNGLQGRSKYGPGFSATNHDGMLVIHHNGTHVLTLYDTPTLPAGFMDRLAHHVMDLLTGRRTVLWDEQAVWGPNGKDAEEVARRATFQAVENIRRIEGGHV